MTPVGRRSDWYSHGLLLHDTDEELVEATRAFVDQGLASDGEVLVHGTRDRVTLMRDVLGSHPRLEYGFDEELYLEPTRTLFTYQHKLADRPEQTEFWVTGTVPLGLDAASRAAWARYESAVDAALAPYPFHALCTYDTRCRPEEVIAAALATHSVIGAVGTTQASPQYLDPAAFLADPLAQVPVPPTSQPSWTYTVEDLNDLAWVRKGFSAGALSGSAVCCPGQPVPARSAAVSSAHPRPPAASAPCTFRRRSCRSSRSTCSSTPLPAPPAYSSPATAPTT